MDRPLILDRYRPLGELASGGFGDVVLAYDTRIQRRVAIKRLPLPRNRSGTPAIPAGLAEARTAALLNHPNIVTVHEWDTDADEAFIIMEYIDGPSVADLLDLDGPLNTELVAAILGDVASALEFAHDNGVLHLDIKPENVLITRDGRAKVADFGVSALSTIAGHGSALGGTLGYMPLEQLHGEMLDESTDVWALAALTFEMLTDANPFASDTIEGAVFKAEIIDPPAPSEFGPSLAREIDDIVLAALETYRVDRYDSVTEFAGRLLPYLGDATAGREELAELAETHATEVGFGPSSLEQLGAWDRLSRFTGIVRRLGAAAASAWLVWAGLGAFKLELLPLAAAAALAAVAGALVPALGTIVGIGMFTVGLAAAGFWLLALVFGVAGSVVWWFAGRTGAAASGALLTPVLGIAKGAPAGGVLLGYEVRPLKAAALAAYAAGLTMLASAASGGRAPYLDVGWRLLLDPLRSRVPNGGVRLLVSTPAPIAVIAAWALAAAVMSLACSRASRAAALAGGALGILTMYGGYVLADLLAAHLNASATWIGEPLLTHVMASSILVVIVVTAGPPVRGEET